MKVFGVLFFIFAVFAVSMAQTSVATTTANEPSDVQVVKMSWKKDSRLAATAYPEETDTASVPPSGRGSQAAQRRRDEKVSVFDRNSRATNEVEDLWPVAGPLISGYLYQATVRNTGQRKIKALNWQYIFTDARDRSIVTRHKFKSLENIAPGKEAKLSRFSAVAPTQVVNAKTLESASQQPYLEQVLIMRIEYADGSVWERPAR